jgi:hypothetical protein
MHNRPQTSPVFAVWHEQEPVLQLVGGVAKGVEYTARDELGRDGHSGPRGRDRTLLIENFLPLMTIRTQHAGRRI